MSLLIRGTLCLLAVVVPGLLSPAGAVGASPEGTIAATAIRVAVPASIDATGARDTAGALMSFVDSVPDGSTISFKAGGTYLLSSALKFRARHYLTFEGNGATFKATGGTTEASSLFWLGSFNGGNSHITIRNFNLVGNSPSPGTFHEGREGAHGILIDGGRDIDISRVTISGIWGDCFYLGSWTTDVVIHDARCASSGRSGVTITSAQNVTVERVAFGRIGYCVFNIEPNASSEGARVIRFRNNTAATWGNSFLSAVGAPGSFVSGISVSGNEVTGGSLLTVIDLPTGRRNITFVNNRSKVRASGPVLRFANIDGLKVYGNVQPLSSGELALITQSTRVTVH